MSALSDNNFSAVYFLALLYKIDIKTIFNYAHNENYSKIIEYFGIVKAP